MNYDTIYEISKPLVPWEIFIVLPMLFIIGQILKEQFAYWKSRKNITFKRAFYIIGVIILLVLCIWFAVIILSPNEEFDVRMEKYQQGQCLILEGNLEVNGFSKYGLADFKVNNEQFTFRYLLKNPLPDKGYVRVYYLQDEYGDNELLKLEVKS